MKSFIRQNFISLVLAILVVSWAGWYASRPQADFAIATAQIDQAAINEMQQRCQSEVLQKNGWSKETCYPKELSSVAFHKSPEYAFNLLFALQKSDPELLGCHLIAHGIGSGTYKRDPTGWQASIRNINPSCGYGAVHGILEGYMGSQPDHSLTKEIIPTICGPNPRADCNHIIGHLTLVETKGSVPEALDLCKVFQNQPAQYRFCLTGVFMEYQTALNLVEHGYASESWLNWPARLPEIEHMCRSYSGDKGLACWEEIVHVALVKFDNDPKKIFDFCNTSQISEGARRCRRHSLGIMAAAKNFNLAEMKFACQIPQKDDPDFENFCYGALVSSALSTAPQLLDQMIPFCSSLAFKFQPLCFTQIGYSLSPGSAERQKLNDICATLSPKVRGYCLGTQPLTQQEIPRND